MWPAKAYRDAAERSSLRGAELDYFCRDMVISSGDHGFHTMHPPTMMNDGVFPEAELPPSTPIDSDASPSDGAMISPLPTNPGTPDFPSTPINRTVSAQLDLPDIGSPPQETRPLMAFPPVVQAGSPVVVATPSNTYTPNPATAPRLPQTGPGPAPAAPLNSTGTFDQSKYHSIGDQ